MKHFCWYLSAGVFLFGLFVNANAMAEMCKWVDRFGITHIQECPSKNKPDPANAKEDPKVEIYVTSWCRYSQQALQYFKTRRISFTAYDIEKDPDARRRQLEINPTGRVPTVVIDGEIIRGYNPEKFDRILNGSR